MARNSMAAAAVSVATVLAASLVLSACLSACVEVPDTIRTHFAAPTPDERSNYRPGRHGTALPAPDPPPLDAGVEPDAAVDAAMDDGGGVS